MNDFSCSSSLVSASRLASWSPGRVVGWVINSGERFSSASRLSSVAAIRRWAVTNWSDNVFCRAASVSPASVVAVSTASAAGFSVSTSSAFCTTRLASSKANVSAVCFIWSRSFDCPPAMAVIGPAWPACHEAVRVFSDRWSTNIAIRMARSWSACSFCSRAATSGSRNWTV